MEKYEPDGVDILFNNAGTNFADEFETYSIKVGSYSNVPYFQTILRPCIGAVSRDGTKFITSMSEVYFV